MNTLSVKAAFSLPYWKGIYFKVKRKEFALAASKVFPFRVDPFSEGSWCAGLQTGSHKSYLLCTRWQKIYLVQNGRKSFLYKMAENLPCSRWQNIYLVQNGRKPTLLKMAENLSYTKWQKTYLVQNGRSTLKQKIYLVQNSRKSTLYKIAENLPCTKWQKMFLV